jgi:DHA3 family tetracycline resistance protein-like MFS transporter
MTMTEAGFRPAVREAGVTMWSALAATARGGLAAAAGSGPVRIAFFVTFFAGASSEAFDRLWGYHLLTRVGVPAGIDEVVLFGGIAVLGQLGGVAIVRLGRAATADISRASLSRLLTVLYLVIGVAVAAFALAGAFWLAVAMLLVVFWARTAETPFFTAWVNRGLDPATRATVLSSVSQGNALGQLGGGPAFAVIAGAGSATVALLLGAVLMAPSALLVRWGARGDAADRGSSSPPL